jgi:hypothetical protein
LGAWVEPWRKSSNRYVCRPVSLQFLYSTGCFNLSLELRYQDGLRLLPQRLLRLVAAQASELHRPPL